MDTRRGDRSVPPALAHAGQTASVRSVPASLTMSSADSSPGTYFGNLLAGKIDNSEMPATIRNDARNALSRVLPVAVDAETTVWLDAIYVAVVLTEQFLRPRRIVRRG